MQHQLVVFDLSFVSLFGYCFGCHSDLSFHCSWTASVIVVVAVVFAVVLDGAFGVTVAFVVFAVVLDCQFVRMQDSLLDLVSFVAVPLVVKQM